MNIQEKLLKVQSELKAPKSQYNKFGGYNYRSCEDILEAVKPLCKEVGALVLVGDEIKEINGRFYIKATARFLDTESNQEIENTAYAREEETKKGMDSSQITGSASSYARKYALNGLLCIDDTKDADTMDNTGNGTKQSTSKQSNQKQITDQQVQMETDPTKVLVTAVMIKTLTDKLAKKGNTMTSVCKYYKVSKPEELTMAQFKDAMNLLESVKDKN